MKSEQNDQKVPAIFTAIPEIMRRVGAISKERYNQQQKFAFRGIDDVYNACQPLMAEYGVFIVPKVLEREQSERETRGGGVLYFTRLLIQHTFYASDGSSIEAITVGEAMDSGDKSANKAMSAAMKYAMIETFAIPTATWEDNDADAQTPEPTIASRVSQSEKTPEQQPQRETIKLATPEQVREIRELVTRVQLPAGTIDKWFARAGVNRWEDVPEEQIRGAIEFVRSKLPSKAQDVKPSETPSPTSEKTPEAPKSPETKQPEAKPGFVARATPAQVAELQTLIPMVTIVPKDAPRKWLDKVGAQSFDEMPGPVIQKCIDYLKEKFREQLANGAGAKPDEKKPETPPAPAATSAPASETPPDSGKPEADIEKIDDVATEDDFEAFGDALVVAAEKAGEVDRISAVLTIVRKTTPSAKRLSEYLVAIEQNQFDWQTGRITTPTSNGQAPEPAASSSSGTALFH